MRDYIKQHINLPNLGLGCFLIFFSCLVLFGFGHEKPFLLNTMDNRIMDMMFKLRGVQPDSGKVIIVDIDEKSLKRLGQWPWPRNLLAKITTNLYKNGARAVGFDIVFAEQDRTSPAYYFKNLDVSIKRQIPDAVLENLLENPSLDFDSIFGHAVSMGPGILGYAFQIKNDGLKSEEQLPFPSGMIRIKPDRVHFTDLSLNAAYRAVINHSLVAMAQSEGFMNMATDASGTARQVPLLMVMDDIPYPSLALEVFRVGMEIPSLTIHAASSIKTPKTSLLGIHMGDRFIPTDSFGQIFLNYRGPENTFKYISAVDVLTDSFLPLIKDKFVMVGSSSTGLFDLIATPFSNAVPGVEIHATIIDNLIRSDPFVYDIFTEIGLNYTLILTGGLFLTLILSILGPLAGGVAAIFFFSGSLAFNYYYFFLNNRHVGMIYPIIAWTGILLGISMFNSFREGKTKRFIQKAFSSYVAPEIVSQLIKNPRYLSLKGEEKELTVLFCDIRGFTSISEKMNSKDLGNFMNTYLSRMSLIIMKNKGTVDKFIGDAIMAFWGAPKEDPDHAVHAVHTALLLKSELKHLNAGRRHPLPEISVGIGINSGVMSVGNFGSKERFDYTVMGDRVNLASRLESANKNYGTTILISDTTKDMIKDTFFCRYIDRVQVKGRQESVDLYEPISGDPLPDEVLAEIKMFEKGINAFHLQKFTEAYDIIDRLHKNHQTQLYQTYLDRITGFMKSPPAFKWDGAERRQWLPVNRLFEK